MKWVFLRRNLRIGALSVGRVDWLQLASTLLRCEHFALPRALSLTMRYGVPIASEFPMCGNASSILYQLRVMLLPRGYREVTDDASALNDGHPR